jgi:genome maintenance exonuclease 1
MNIHLPVLQKVTLESGTRYYVTPEGIKYPSVTTVISKRKKEQLKEWRDRVGEEVAKEISKAATIRGNSFHNNCEQYLKKEPITESIGSMFDRFIPLLDRISDIICLEQHLYSNELRVAGQVDCVGKFDGKDSIIDFKTSSKLKQKDIIWDYFMQATAYSYMLEERTSIKISNLTILITCETGEVQVFQDVRENWIEGFKKLREEYEKYVEHSFNCSHNNKMNDRITTKWTESVVEAFGDKPNVNKGVKAEKLIHSYLKNIYNEVKWFHNKRDKQLRGIDFEFKKDSWKNSYTADVKGNLQNGRFFVYLDEIRNKVNHRMIHVDTDTGWAVEYDRVSMINYLDSKPELLKKDKNNNKYALLESYSFLLKRRINHFRPFKIKLS